MMSWSGSMVMLVALTCTHGVAQPHPEPPGYREVATPSAMLATSSMQERIEPVDVNRATAVQLQTVPGIGPATAQRIIEWREQNGRFERLEDLLNIRGIGEKTLEKLRPYLTVGKEDKAAG